MNLDSEGIIEMNGQTVEPMKKDVRRVCRVMLLTLAVLYAMEFLLCDVFAQIFWERYPLASLDELMEQMNASGTLMIFAEGTAALTACLLLACNRKLGMFAEKRKAGFSRMSVFFFCMLGVELFVSLLVAAMEMGLNAMGLSLTGALEVASTVKLTPSMLAYSVLFAPVFEELIFRGAFLHVLAPYGKRFAIAFSALLFGLMHGNIVQLPVAFFLGLLLGYVAIEYSLQAAMVLHSLCNVYVSVQSLLMEYEGSLLLDLLGVLVLVGFLVLSGVVFRYRTNLAQYVREGRVQPGCVRAVLTSVSFWIVTACTLLFTALSVGIL